MNKPVVGIDLGTTYSEIAYVGEDGRPHYIPSPDGKFATPSAVLIDGSRVVVGEMALNEWIINQDHVVRWIKRSIGDADYRFQGRSPVEISAEILKSLRRDAEVFFGQPVEDAVITCPAYFAAIEIENTRNAGELAGLKVREIVKEPTAAAVYYGVDNMRDGEKIMVCDLGGGTYDATILALEKGVFTPLASMGDRQLGGHDWTMELVNMVAEAFQARCGVDPRNDLVASQQLYEACERAKRDLKTLAEVTVPCHCHGRTEQISVTREEFETRTEWKIQALVMWCERAMAKAQPPLTWADVDRILLVGGSSRLRRMALALEEHSGKKPVQTAEPDLMVAYGAAILAYGKVRPRKPATGLVEAPRTVLMEVSYKRIAARNLGTRVIVFETAGPRKINSVIIPHGTETPVERSRDYEVSSRGQACFDVPVLEYESDDEFDVVNNYRFQCPLNAQRGDPVRVTFKYDISGIVTVEAVDVKSGRLLVGDRQPYKEPEITAAPAQFRPRWVVFAVDTSYSMEGVKMQNAKQAVIDNARVLLTLGGERCKVGIVSFASSARVVCQPTSDLGAVERAARSLTPSGSTAMDDGVLTALDLVLKAPPETDREVVMVTDGMPDDDRRSRTLSAAQDCGAKSVTLCTLGVGKDDVDLTFLTQMTPHALRIDKPEEMTEAITTLLAQSAAARGRLTDT